MKKVEKDDINNKITKLRFWVIVIKIILWLAALALFCLGVVYTLQQLGVAFSAGWGKLPVWTPKFN